MSAPFDLPDLGEGLVEAEVVAWHVAAGDHVVADQPLVSVETDKAVVEIPAPRAGRIARLCAEVGDVVAVGAPLVEYETGPAADPGAVVGTLPDAGAAPAPSPPRAPATARVRASPKARQRARELGVDLGAVPGSGHGGVVQVADVEAVAASAGTPDAGAAEPLRGVRAAMARRMSDAHARVVPATVTGEADVSAWAGSARTLPRLIRAIGAACTAEPRLNMAFDDTAMTLRVNATVDLGVAMETEEGLFVPVVHDVRALSPDGLQRELERLKAAVRDRSVAAADLTGQTITLSNFGSVGGLYAQMVVVPPQVAIVGAGRTFPRAVPGPDRVGVHTMLPISISFDHRAVTGVEACRFLNALVADLEEPID